MARGTRNDMGHMDGSGTEAGAALLTVFHHVYLINLPDRRDRRIASEAQLQRIGLSLDHPRVTLFPAIRPDDAAGFPSRGARGCFLSHLGVLRAAVAAGHPSFVVLEDDVDFAPDFGRLMSEVAAALATQTWHIAYGFDPHPQARHDLRIVPASEPIEALHFIGVQHDAAARLIPYLEAILRRPPGDAAGGPMHVDGAYSWFRAAHPELVTLASGTALAEQRASRSDISPTSWIDQVPILRQASHRGRDIRSWWRGRRRG